MNDKRWESNLKKLAKSLIKVETVNNSEREGLYEICFLEIRKHNIWKKSGWKVEKSDFFKKGDIVLVPYTIKDSFTTLTDVSTSMFLSLTVTGMTGSGFIGAISASIPSIYNIWFGTMSKKLSTKDKTIATLQTVTTLGVYTAGTMLLTNFAGWLSSWLFTAGSICFQISRYVLAGGLAGLAFAAAGVLVGWIFSWWKNRSLLCEEEDAIKEINTLMDLYNEFNNKFFKNKNTLGKKQLKKLETNSSEKEITNVYKNMVLVFHPDKQKNNELRNLIPSYANSGNFKKLTDAKEKLIKTRMELGKYSPAGKILLTIIKHSKKIFSNNGVDSNLLKKINKECGVENLNARLWEEEIDLENFVKGYQTQINLTRNFKKIDKNTKKVISPEISFTGNVINLDRYHGYGKETWEYDDKNFTEVESNYWNHGKRNGRVTIVSKGLYLQQNLVAKYDNDKLLSCKGDKKLISEPLNEDFNSQDNKKFILEQIRSVEYNGEFINDKSYDIFNFTLDGKKCTEKIIINRRLKEKTENNQYKYLDNNELNCHLEWTTYEVIKTGEFKNGNFIDGTRTEEYSKII